MKRTQILGQLQQIDLQLAAKRALVGQDEAKRADETSILGARADLERISTARAGLEAKLQDSDLLAKTLTGKAQAVGKRLYSGGVSNPKELSGLEKDAEMIKHQRSELDDKMLDLMGQLELAQAEEQTARTKLEAMEAERKKDLARIAHEIAKLEEQIAELTRQRDDFKSKLSPQDWGLYEELARTHSGRAVSHLKGPACSACGVDVPTGLRSRVIVGEELALCTNCGRILVP